MQTSPFIAFKIRLSLVNKKKGSQEVKLSLLRGNGS